jgi:inosine kinase
MKFPGRRKKKHYFPVENKGRDALEVELSREHNSYLVGLDQLLVDIEVNVTDDFLTHHQFQKGESFIIDDELANRLYTEFKEKKIIKGEFPGGAVGNTLHNYSVLSEAPCFAIGAIEDCIKVGDYAFKYISKTSSKVDLSHLQPSDKSMGRALCFITPDMERTFAISKGCMNDFKEENVSVDLIKNASAVLLSAYTLRNEREPIFKASIRTCEIAKEYNVPVVFSLGTSGLVDSQKDYLKTFIKDYVTVLAMNQSEGRTLLDLDDDLDICTEILEYVDLCLYTVGASGLYIASYCDDQFKRHTKDELRSASLVDFNKYEYSRSMKKEDCENPIKIYTHIYPFLGGPLSIKNTNGAGDAALAALLHDLTANNYHKHVVPNSPKHIGRFLTYSSIAQVSKYCNRASFEVLSQNSPRLYKGLPEREASLDEGYWSK